MPELKGEPPAIEKSALFHAWNVDRDRSLGTRVVLAGSSEERRTGLLRRESFPAGSGLWIAPCEAVHTFGMKFAIDIIFLSRDMQVLKLYAETRRNRICFCLRASSVLELPAGTIETSGTSVSDLLHLRSEKLAI